jgi:HD superfamily phosphohydrolase
MKLIRDPIHGYIEISDKMNKIISDPYFQRLRYIKQTAMAYMVYPSMLHSRFEHSLGVMHLAREFARYVISNSGLKDEEGLIQMIALTGLLHDIGHVAFSHTFENFLLLANQVYGLKVKEEGKKTHVNYGTYLIENVLGSIIDKEFTEFYPDPVKFIIDVLRETKEISSFYRWKTCNL